MRAMRAEGFSGYKDLKLVDIPKPAVSDGRVLVRITAAGVTPLEHTILSGGIPASESTSGLGRRGSRCGGGGRGNGLSCRFTCDVYGAVWRFREWKIQRVACCPQGENLFDSRQYRGSVGCRCSRCVSDRPNDTELCGICKGEVGAVTCHRRFGRKRSHSDSEGARGETRDINHD